MKTIGIALFDGFALPEIARIVESFQRANEIGDSNLRGAARFNVCLLSTIGGRIVSSSSIFVWTERIGAGRHPSHLHALLVAGGAGVSHALRDEELLGWLRRTCPLAEHVLSVGEGKLLLDAAGLGHHAAAARQDDELMYRCMFPELAGESAGERLPGPLHSARRTIGGEMGRDVARQIMDIVAPSVSRQFNYVVHRNAGQRVSERIQTSARWLEENGHRHVGIDEAAQVAEMSERNFLRRFKAELGVTPSDYLLHVRLDMSCRLLAETALSVDKVARRCGIGSGGQLSKLFRKHLGKTPTDYRANHRLSGWSD